MLLLWDRNLFFFIFFQKRNSGSLYKKKLLFLKTEVSSPFYKKSKLLYIPEHKFLKKFLVFT